MRSRITIDHTGFRPHTWETFVKFVEPEVTVLLGHRGFLDRWDATFFGKRHTMKLEAGSWKKEGSEHQKWQDCKPFFRRYCWWYSSAVVNAGTGRISATMGLLNRCDASK